MSQHVMPLVTPENVLPRLPSTDIRVIKFSCMVIGQICGMVLAELGADAIKIQPSSGDNTLNFPGLDAGFLSGPIGTKKARQLTCLRLSVWRPPTSWLPPPVSWLKTLIPAQYWNLASPTQTRRSLMTNWFASFTRAFRLTLATTARDLLKWCKWWMECLVPSLRWWLRQCGESVVKSHEQKPPLFENNIFWRCRIWCICWKGRNNSAHSHSYLRLDNLVIFSAKGEK